MIYTSKITCNTETKECGIYGIQIFRYLIKVNLLRIEGKRKIKGLLKCLTRIQGHKRMGINNQMGSPRN
jgi:hypothetical protein